jgi:hypothetical protein
MGDHVLMGRRPCDSRPREIVDPVPATEATALSAPEDTEARQLEPRQPETIAELQADGERLYFTVSRGMHSSTVDFETEPSKEQLQQLRESADVKFDQLGDDHNPQLQDRRRPRQ